MKKFLIIVLIAQVSTLGLFRGGVLSELMRMPLLVEHFLDHQEEEEMSLLAFFQMHYFGEKVMDEDYQSDQELPFQTGGSDISTVPVHFTVPHTFSYQSLERYSFISYPTEITNASYSSIAIAIFQPPKLG